MQQRNFILFLVLSVGILISWVYLQNLIWPRKTKDEEKQEAKDQGPKKAKPLSPAAQQELFLSLTGASAPMHVGALDALRVAQRVAAGVQLVENERYWKNLKPGDRQQLVESL